MALTPIGAPLVWLPAALWLFFTGATGWAVFLVLWGIFVVGGADNIIRPYLSAGAAICLLFWFSSESSVEPLPLVFSVCSWGPRCWQRAMKLCETGRKPIRQPRAFGLRLNPL